ncbi:uncharacterized protein RHOBADRAFT_51019, partial [Rhodotorula graminis WP1]
HVWSGQSDSRTHSSSSLRTNSRRPHPRPAPDVAPCRRGRPHGRRGQRREQPQQQRRRRRPPPGRLGPRPGPVGQRGQHAPREGRARDDPVSPSPRPRPHLVLRLSPPLASRPLGSPQLCPHLCALDPGRRRAQHAPRACVGRVRRGRRQRVRAREGEAERPWWRERGGRGEECGGVRVEQGARQGVRGQDHLRPVPPPAQHGRSPGLERCCRRRHIVERHRRSSLGARCSRFDTLGSHRSSFDRLSSPSLSSFPRNPSSHPSQDPLSLCAPLVVPPPFLYNPPSPRALDGPPTTRSTYR